MLESCVQTAYYCSVIYRYERPLISIYNIFLTCGKKTNCVPGVILNQNLNFSSTWLLLSMSSYIINNIVFLMKKKIIVRENVFCYISFLLLYFEDW